MRARVMIGEALSAELEVERSAGALWVDGPQVSPRLLGRCFAWLDVYAASTGSRVELALLSGGPEAALALVEDAREYARRTERPALARFLSALRVAVLLDKGEVDEAARAWRFDRLPEQAAECLDLGSLSWREMEMLACARLRLFIARGEFDAARQFAAALQAVASERGLVRTRMRGLALSIALEHRAEALDRASAHLVDYLRLFAEADYVRPLARDRTVALALLDDVACATGGDASVASAAEALRKAPVRGCGRRGTTVGPGADRARNGRVGASGAPDRQGHRPGPGALLRRRALPSALHLREARGPKQARRRAARPGARHPACRGGGAGSGLTASGGKPGPSLPCGHRRAQCLARVDEAVHLGPVLSVVQLPVSAVQRHEFGVGSTLHDPALLDHEDLVRAVDGRQPVDDLRASTRRRRFRCNVFVTSSITMSYSDHYLYTITIAMCSGSNSLSPDSAPTGADTGPSEKRSNSSGVAGVARTNRGLPDATYGCPARSVLTPAGPERCCVRDRLHLSR